MSARVLKFSAFALVIWAASVGSATSAQAALVTYYTTGAFNNTPAAPGVSPTSLTLGGVTLTFTGVGTAANPYDINPNPTTHDSLGVFTIAGSTTDLGDFSGTTFNLYITQMVPAPNNGYASFTSTITGTIQWQSSGAVLTFNQPLSQVITSTQSPNSVTYTVESTVSLPPPNEHNGGVGTVTLEGDITAAPEPSTMVLAVAGLPMLGFVAWRRKRLNPA